MAIYRNISLTFWTDNKVSDDFTYKDKYLMLYLLTNPHTNIIGCYEISYKQMSSELGMPIAEIKKLIDKMQNVHKTILYSETTKEMLIKNWSRYNWTKSTKLHKPIIENIKLIKDSKFKLNMVSIAKSYGIDTVSIEVEYPIDTTVTVTDTDTDYINIYFNNIEELINYIQSKLNYILNNSNIEINTLKLWIDNKIPKDIIKYAFEEARRRNINEINYINKIVINRVEELKEKNTQKPPDDKLPAWFDKKIEKDSEGIEELEKVLEDFRKEDKDSEKV